MSLKGVYQMQERWIADRAMLQQLMQKHPEWTQQELANWIGCSKGWVKKWVKRLREAPPGDASVLFGKPFGRKTPYPQTDPVVEARILAIRDTPPENLKRTPGPRAILYYLPRDPSLQECTEVLPRSTRTIWKILRRNDRITQEKRRKRKSPQRQGALEEIQMDFKDIATVPKAETGKQQHVVEALNFMDAGTSILLDAQVQADFHAQTTLQAVIRFLQRYGLPPKITFDRDPRLVGAATGRDFPSPLVRFLLCLGITPNVCPPHRPDKNAFVERYHRTYNQECIQVHCPHTLKQAQQITEAFAIHYNTERPNQALSCGNQPPRVAFPQLKSLSPLPQLVDPDAWLSCVHGKHFIRKVRQNGTVRIAEGSYYVHLVVNARRSEQVLPSHMSICPQC